MSTQRLKNKKGFTLVEISIVLVIIGLLLGGVLKGQELIENAKITTLYKELTDIKTAYHSYKDSYGVYPGNYSKITNRVTSESQFWDDLISKGALLSQKNPFGFNYRISESAPVYSFSNSNSSGTFAIMSPFEISDKSSIDSVCTKIPDAQIGLYLDTRYDDQNNQTGSFIFTIDLTEYAPSLANIPPYTTGFIIKYEDYKSYFIDKPGWVCLRLD